jgi:hypothetical protein
MMKFIPLFALCIAVKFASSSPAAERPNLVFIIADDCTYLDMGVYGGQAKTPPQPSAHRLAMVCALLPAF